MSSDEQMNATLRRWREGVRGKERRVFRLEERIEIRIAAIEKRLHQQRFPLDEWETRNFFYRMPDDIEFTEPDWRKIHVGENWGGPNVSAYFRRSVTIPDEMDGKPVMMRMYLGGDSLVTVNGVPHAGLDIFRNELMLTPKAKAGETFDILIESYVYWHGGEPNVHAIEIAELATVDPEIHAAYWDFRAAVKMFALIDLDARLRSFLEKTVWEPLKDVAIDEPDLQEFKRILAQAQARLKREFYDSECFHGDGLMHMVGHSHLDVVFMWTYGEFVRKVGRTHSTMLRLMETYPEFKFSQSQAKIYADMKTHYPALFEQVKQRVAEGRWEPLGAFWVEPDCNLISGESFVRQVMQGQQFWQHEFGYTSRICWQPDVFGVSWALPQILKRSGIDYFMTNKMVVWNDTNKWTKNTFWWESPDGSRVLCIIPPGHFIGTLDPDQMMLQWNAFSDRGTVGESLYTFGWGDGGGGCDAEMLECGRRYSNTPGMVQTHFTTAQQAFTSIKEKALENNIPVVNDELYLEAHRGTYTSRGRLKRLNRRGEFLLREVELFTTLA
ncbi:MAG: alpha-mannosidase, partial [bacterium]